MSRSKVIKLESGTAGSLVSWKALGRDFVHELVGTDTDFFHRHTVTLLILNLAQELGRPWINEHFLFFNNCVRSVLSTNFTLDLAARTLSCSNGVIDSISHPLSSLEIREGRHQHLLLCMPH